VRLSDDSVVPAAEQEEAFMGALLPTRENGRARVVDLCDPVVARQFEQAIAGTELALLPRSRAPALSGMGARSR
jgi:hypothetical protein